MAEAFLAEYLNWPNLNWSNRDCPNLNWPNERRPSKPSTARACSGPLGPPPIHPPDNPLDNFFKFDLFLSFFIYLNILCIFRPLEEFGHSRYSAIQTFRQFRHSVNWSSANFFFGQLEFGHNHYYRIFIHYRKPFMSELLYLRQTFTWVCIFWYVNMLAFFWKFSYITTYLKRYNFIKLL